MLPARARPCPRTASHDRLLSILLIGATTLLFIDTPLAPEMMVRCVNPLFVPIALAQWSYSGPITGCTGVLDPYTASMRSHSGSGEKKIIAVNSANFTLYGPNCFIRGEFIITFNIFSMRSAAGTAGAPNISIVIRDGVHFEGLMDTGAGVLVWPLALPRVELKCAVTAGALFSPDWLPIDVAIGGSGGVTWSLSDVAFSKDAFGNSDWYPIKITNGHHIPRGSRITIANTSLGVRRCVVININVRGFTISLVSLPDTNPLVLLDRSQLRIDNVNVTLSDIESSGVLFDVFLLSSDTNSPITLRGEHPHGGQLAIHRSTVTASSTKNIVSVAVIRANGPVSLLNASSLALSGGCSVNVFNITTPNLYTAVISMNNPLVLENNSQLIITGNKMVTTNCSTDTLFVYLILTYSTIDLFDSASVSVVNNSVIAENATAKTMFFVLLFRVSQRFALHNATQLNVTGANAVRVVTSSTPTDMYICGLVVWSQSFVLRDGSQISVDALTVRADGVWTNTSLQVMGVGILFAGTTNVADMYDHSRIIITRTTAAITRAKTALIGGGVRPLASIFNVPTTILRNHSAVRLCQSTTSVTESTIGSTYYAGPYTNPATVGPFFGAVVAEGACNTTHAPRPACGLSVAATMQSCESGDPIRLITATAGASSSATVSAHTASATDTGIPTISVPTATGTAAMTPRSKSESASLPANTHTVALTQTSSLRHHSLSVAASASHRPIQTPTVFTRTHRAAPISSTTTMTLTTSNAYSGSATFSAPTASAAVTSTRTTMPPSASHSLSKSIARTQTRHTADVREDVVTAPPRPAVIPAEGETAVVAVAGMIATTVAADLQAQSALTVSRCALEAAGGSSAATSDRSFRALSPLATEDSCDGVFQGHTILLAVSLLVMVMAIVAIGLLRRSRGEPTRPLHVILSAARFPSLLLAVAVFMLSGLVVCAGRTEGTAQGVSLTVAVLLSLAGPVLAAVLGTRQYVAFFRAPVPANLRNSAFASALVGALLPQGELISTRCTQTMASVEDDDGDGGGSPATPQQEPDWPRLLATAVGAWRMPTPLLAYVPQLSVIALTPAVLASGPTCTPLHWLSAALFWSFAVAVIALRPRRVLIVDLLHAAALIVNGAVVAAVAAGAPQGGHVPAALGVLQTAITVVRVAHAVLLALVPRFYPSLRDALEAAATTPADDGGWVYVGWWHRRPFYVFSTPTTAAGLTLPQSVPLMALDVCAADPLAPRILLEADDLLLSEGGGAPSETADNQSLLEEEHPLDLANAQGDTADSHDSPRVAAGDSEASSPAFDPRPPAPLLYRPRAPMLPGAEAATKKADDDHDDQHLPRCMYSSRDLQRRPADVLETLGIKCPNLLKDAVLERADREARKRLLEEQQHVNTCQTQQPQRMSKPSRPHGGVTEWI